MLTVMVSASGSPGVTSTALGLAVRWTRPVVLVEADPTGGSGILAGFFRAQLDHPGLIDLVIAQRSDLLADALPRLLLPIEGTQASVLVGSRSHEQAAGIAQLWQPLLDALRQLEPTGTDVIVDAGRLGLNGWPHHLVTGSDLTLLVVRADLPGLAGARSWANTLAADNLAGGHYSRVLLVGEGRPYGRGEVGRTLGMPVLASIDHDPASAAVYSHGRTPPPPRWWQRIGRGPDAARAVFEASDYVRSLVAAAEAIRAVPAPQPMSPFRSVLAQAGAAAEGGTRR